MHWRKKLNIDLSKMSVEELRALTKQAKTALEIRRFEEGLKNAVQEYRGRDPEVIRF